jgi:4-amino-4-deoxy-L-arabinose transferase-like glycosyltransferase
MMPVERHRLPFIWALFIGAFALRVLHLHLGEPAAPQDTPDYDEIAGNLIAGDGFVSRENWFGHEMRSWRAPFYPFFLATVYALFGHSHLVVQLLQCVVGAATVVLVYRCARLTRPAMAIGVGLVGIVYGPLAAVSSEVMTETWFVFWVVFAIYLLIQVLSGQGPTRHLSLAAGAAVGMAALTRPVGILIGVAFGITAIWRLRRRGIRLILWVGVAVLGVMLPWAIRNYAVHHTFVPITTHGGFILARSHAPTPDWKRADGWGIEARTFEQIPSEVARDRYWRAQGWTQIQADIGRYLRYSAERFLRFWYFLRPGYNVWFMIVLPLSLAGLVRVGGSPEFQLIRIYTVLSVLLCTFVFYGSARFRLPLEPFLLLFAGAFVAECARKSRKGALSLVAAVVAVNILLYALQEPLRGALLPLLHAWNLK